MSTNTPTPRTDAQADIEITVTTNSGKKETWSLDAVSKRFAREMETELRAKLAKVTAERDEAVGDLHKFRMTYELWPNHRDIVAALRARVESATPAPHADTVEECTDQLGACIARAELRAIYAQDGKARHD